MTGARQIWLQASDLLDKARRDTGGYWPRAVALLARQALEAGLDALWRAKAPSLVDCSRRAQLVCLRSYTDAETARAAGVTWSALSSACHYRVYDLAPSWRELETWIALVEEVLDAFADADVSS